jgi:putative copper resistance protein D
VTQLLDIFAYISVLLRGLTLASEALTVGGVIFVFVVARTDGKDVRSRLLLLLRGASVSLAAAQLCYVAGNSAILVGSAGLTWEEISGATFWVAGGMVALGASIILISARAGLRPMVTGGACSIGCIGIVLGSVMASHSISRLDHRPALVSMTLAHHIASAAWIGGMPYLIVALRHAEDAGTVTRIAGRFSIIAMASAASLTAAGAGLSRFYIGSAAALKGTTYGIMLLSKVVLTLFLLFLGALNFKIVQAARSGLPPTWLSLRRFAEVEAGIGITVLLAAASLTSAPPAIDVRTGVVTGAEIMQRMKPKRPRLQTPLVSELSPPGPRSREGASAQPESLVPGQVSNADSPADIAWSEYNHHYAGLVVLSIGLASLLARRFAWAQHWPLLFLGLALFLFIRADSENWPLGPRGFWESFQVAEVAQHRLFVVLIVVFAVFEWAVQTNRLPPSRAGLVFPLVCLAGSALLQTHSHSLTNVKEEFLAELSHIPIAILGMVTGWSRWLELRLPRGQLRVVVWIWPVSLILIGALLLNYRES